MRAVIQRVLDAQVISNGTLTGKIGKGLVVLFAVHKDDTIEKIPWFVQKLLHLRIFEDDAGKMNLSLIDVKGEMLVVSQFTLYGNCNEGRRPDFIQSAPGSIAEPIYDKLVSDLKKELTNVQTGLFGAEMQVTLTNDGPVTFIVDR